MEELSIYRNSITDNMQSIDTLKCLPLERHGYGNRRLEKPLQDYVHIDDVPDDDIDKIMEIADVENMAALQLTVAKFLVGGPKGLLDYKGNSVSNGIYRLAKMDKILEDTYPIVYKDLVRRVNEAYRVAGIDHSFIENPGNVLGNAKLEASSPSDGRYTLNWERLLFGCRTAEPTVGAYRDFRFYNKVYDKIVLPEMLKYSVSFPSMAAPVAATTYSNYHDYKVAVEYFRPSPAALRELFGMSRYAQYRADRTLDKCLGVIRIRFEDRMGDTKEVEYMGALGDLCMFPSSWNVLEGTVAENALLGTASREDAGWHLKTIIVDGGFLDRTKLSKDGTGHTCKTLSTVTGRTYRYIRALNTKVPYQQDIDIAGENLAMRRWMTKRFLDRVQGMPLDVLNNGNLHTWDMVKQDTAEYLESLSSLGMGVLSYNQHSIRMDETPNSRMYGYNQVRRPFVSLPSEWYSILSGAISDDGVNPRALGRSHENDFINRLLYNGQPFFTTKITGGSMLTNSVMCVPKEILGDTRLSYQISQKVYEILETVHPCKGCTKKVVECAGYRQTPSNSIGAGKACSPKLGRTWNETKMCANILMGHRLTQIPKPSKEVLDAMDRVRHRDPEYAHLNVDGGEYHDRWGSNGVRVVSYHKEPGFSVRGICGFGNGASKEDIYTQQVAFLREGTPEEMLKSCVATCLVKPRLQTMFSWWQHNKYSPGFSGYASPSFAMGAIRGRPVVLPELQFRAIMLSPAVLPRVERFETLVHELGAFYKIMNDSGFICVDLARLQKAAYKII